MEMHLSNRASLSDMAPGDIVFLDDFAYLRSRSPPISSPYWLARYVELQA